MPSGDERALAGALTGLRDDYGQRTRLAQAARSWALGHAGVDAMVASYQQLYARLAQS